MYCQSCGAEVGQEASFCPNCGQQVGQPAQQQAQQYNPPPTPKKRTSLKVVVVIVVLLIVSGFGLAVLDTMSRTNYTPPNQQSSDSTDYTPDNQGQGTEPQERGNVEITVTNHRANTITAYVYIDDVVSFGGTTVSGQTQSRSVSLTVGSHTVDLYVDDALYDTKTITVTTGHNNPVDFDVY